MTVIRTPSSCRGWRTPGNVQVIQKPASCRERGRSTEKQFSMSSRERSAFNFDVQQSMRKHKEFPLEMRQKFAEGVDQAVQIADRLSDPIVNTRITLKSPKEGEACWVNVEFDVVNNPIRTDSLPEDIVFHPSFERAFQEKDQKSLPLSMDGNWDKWLQEMDPEMKFMQQQDQSKIVEQMTNSQNHDILGITEGTKQKQLPGQQEYKEDLSKGEVPTVEAELASVRESSKYNSLSKPSEYLDFSIGTKTTGTAEKEAKMMFRLPDNCNEKPLEEDCSEMKQTSPAKVGECVTPAKAPENFSDGFFSSDNKRVSEEESVAKNEKGIPTVSPHKLVNRPIQHQKVVLKSMSEPIAEALVLVPEDDLTDISKPICHEETGKPTTPAPISGLETNIKQGSTTH